MKRIVLFLFIAGTFSNVIAKSITVDVYRTVADDKKAASIGKITFEDSCYGLLIRPELHGLKPGIHGFHVHQNPDCGKLGMNAGGHLDPDNTGKHLGPYNNNGHLGAMPPLFVDKKGKSTLPVLAPRLRVRDLTGHAIIVHENGDNFSDTPKPLGGGGKRIACGVVEDEKPVAVAAKKKK